jgi:hypothetical protein
MSYEKKTFNEIVNKSKYLSIRNQKNWWLDSNIQKIFREACDHFLEYNLNEELTSNKKSGIVICGGGKYLLSTYCVIKGIRHFGCSLPITLFCYNEEEITEKDKKLFSNLDVKIRTLSNDPEAKKFRNLKSYAIKIYSICYCDYENVILIDADNLPFFDISELQNTDEYDYECIFFKDIIHDLKNSVINNNYLNPHNCEVFGVEHNGYESTDSGLIYINKHLYRSELLLTKWYNEFSDFYYNFNLGDKDLYLFAWKKMNRYFHFNYEIPERRNLCCLIHKDRYGRELSCHLAGSHNKIKDDIFALDNIDHGEIYKDFIKQYKNIKDKKIKMS